MPITLSNPFTVEDVQRSSRVQPSERMVATAMFGAVQLLAEYCRSNLYPLLEPGRSRRTDALRTLQARITSLLVSLSQLNHPVHAQAVAATSRIVFELSLDTQLLHSDAYGNGLDRFVLFTDVERLRSATKLVQYDNGHPGEIARSTAPERDFIAANHERLRPAAERMWGLRTPGSWPPHWSGEDTRRRASRVGAEHLYMQFYPMLSWYVHPGAVGFDGLPLEAFDALVGISLKLTLDTSIAAMTTVRHEFALGEPVEREIEFLSHVPGLILTDLQLAELGEPRRFIPRP